MDSHGPGDTPENDPDLPPMIKIGDVLAPAAPQDKEAVKHELPALMDMAVKTSASVARFTTEWFAQQMMLSLPLSRRLLETMSQEGFIEELWSTGKGSSHYRIVQLGRDLAARLTEACGYIGQAPVRMETYAAMLRYQFAMTPQVKPDQVMNALSGLVLPKKSTQLAGLAVSSGRSLFVYGPSGNGKSSLGRQIHSALPGDYWVPYSITVGGSIVRVFDDQCHKKVDFGGPKVAEAIDQRWVRVRRPLVIVGGELTLDMLDLIYSPTYKFYEAPPHLKANGGVFLVDDFGRERISPEQLLNRFITPMEHQFDYFTLRTGQKIQLPLRHVLIIATNLSPETVTDPAFLRRMGYRLMLKAPSEKMYTRIFTEYAQRNGVEPDPAVIEQILQRYRSQGREMRACEPRDLIERCKDICAFHSRPLELSMKVLDIAWTGYFGEALPMNKADQAKPEDQQPDDGEAE